MPHSTGNVVHHNLTGIVIFLPVVRSDIVFIVPKFVAVQTTVDKFSHQTHRQDCQGKRHHPLTSARTNENGNYRHDDDRLGYSATNASPPAQDAKCSQNRTGHVQEEGRDSVPSSEWRKEQLLDVEIKRK